MKIRNIEVKYGARDGTMGLTLKIFGKNFGKNTSGVICKGAGVKVERGLYPPQIENLFALHHVAIVNLNRAILDAP